MTYEKTFQGAHKFSEMVNGQLVTEQFFFYTKAEAKRLFKQSLREEARRKN